MAAQRLFLINRFDTIEFDQRVLTGNCQMPTIRAESDLPNAHPWPVDGADQIAGGRVPDFDLTIIADGQPAARGRQVLSVGTVGYRPKVERVAGEGADHSAFRPVPYLYRFVATGGGEKLAVRTERYAANRPVMANERSQRLLTVNGPDRTRAVEARRGRGYAVGMQRDTEKGPACATQSERIFVGTPL